MVQFSNGWALAMAMAIAILYLSGLNMMEGILNKEQLAKVPSKTKKPS